MSQFALYVKAIHYLSEYQVPVTATRVFADLQFATNTAAPIRLACVVDSGAPLSVIPFSLWHDRQLQWTSLGAQLSVQGRPVQDALTWQGIYCDLGCTRVELCDIAAGLLAGPYLVIGKFAHNPHPQPEIENLLILGVNFLTDNFLEIKLDGKPGSLVATLLDQ